MPSLPFFWVDAFTDRAFGGNPAAVVPLASWLPDAALQQMAAQHRLSETAFFVPRAEGRYQLRWFTPAVEVDLCGHATLASAHVLYQELGFSHDRVTFETRSGELPVARGEQGRLTMDFPSRPARPVSCPAELSRALAGDPDFCGQMSTSWFLVYGRAEQVRTMNPDHAALARLKPGRFIVTAQGGGEGIDFVSRFFAPDAGVEEDPVTGSAHCVLTPYWAEKLGRNTLRALQVSRRGGELWCELAGDRVKISGRAATYIRGKIQLP